MAAVYGYARVSTSEQDLTVQREALLAAGCSTVRDEKRSGAIPDSADQRNIDMTRRSNIRSDRRRRSASSGFAPRPPL
jgi:hypothetical protein